MYYDIVLNLLIFSMLRIQYKYWQIRILGGYAAVILYYVHAFSLPLPPLSPPLPHPLIHAVQCLFPILSRK